MLQTHKSNNSGLRCFKTHTTAFEVSLLLMVSFIIRKKSSSLSHHSGVPRYWRNFTLPFKEATRDSFEHIIAFLAISCGQEFERMSSIFSPPAPNAKDRTQSTFTHQVFYNHYLSPMKYGRTLPLISLKGCLPPMDIQSSW